jgi:hypothetical protein
MGAADVEQLPLVSLELGRVTAGFRDAARELGVTRRVVADAGAGTLGTPACDPAVEAGLRDLAAVLSRLESTAATCVRALARYEDRGT